MNKNKTHLIKSKSDLSYFMVVDMEEGGHMKLLRVKYSNESQTYEGTDDSLFSCRSPLCQHVVVGDIVVGYQLRDDCGNNVIYESLSLLDLKAPLDMPDVLLVDSVKDSAFQNRQHSVGKVEWKNEIKATPMGIVHANDDTDDEIDQETIGSSFAVAGCESDRLSFIRRLAQLHHDDRSDIADMCKSMEELSSRRYSQDHKDGDSAESLLQEFQKMRHQ